ncbi:hypothetical protein PIB30_080317 [Stylosanthes scabra]|uniref:Uncharacterized protein n=1 Tax=Stylosanthes scabra TaxID=79078 RepID=A0ABU6SRU7_9FABA|nr:hypothetical protein [Stylosanthes scabra]
MMLMHQAQVKACEEAEARLKSTKKTEKEKDNEIAIDIRRIVEVVVAEAREMEAQEKEAASDLNKLDQPAPGLMMIASTATQEDDYDPNKAFDIGLGTQPQQRESPEEMYDLDDFPEEPENPVSYAVPAPTIVVPNRPVAESSQHNNDLKERCVIWALPDKKEIRYDSIFMIKGE